MIAFRITVGVLVKHRLIEWIQFTDLVRTEDPVKFVQLPGNGAFRNELGGYYTIANLIVNELEFGVGWIIGENPEKNLTKIKK